MKYKESAKKQPFKVGASQRIHLPQWIAKDGVEYYLTVVFSSDYVTAAYSNVKDGVLTFDGIEIGASKKLMKHALSVLYKMVRELRKLNN